MSDGRPLGGITAIEIGTAIAGPETVPYNLSLVGLTYYAQAFCGSPGGGAFFSNALEQRIGI